MVSGSNLRNVQARDFRLSKIGRDQVEDTERWLAPNLGYQR